MTSPEQTPPEPPKRTLREEVTNLPNLLTFTRIAMIPPVMVLMLQESRVCNVIAALLFTLAAITDWLDGYLARKRNLVSVLGKLLDPLADKLIVTAALVIAAELGRIPGWFVVLLLSRELAIQALRAIASSEGMSIDVVSSGKFKTAFQLIGLVALLIHERFTIDFLFFTRVIDFNALGIGLLGLAMVFSLASAGQYFAKFLGAIAKR